MTGLNITRRQLRHRCIDYAYIAYTYLKKTQHEFIKKFQLKRYLLCENPEEGFSKYHYYIELDIIHNNKRYKCVLDNDDCGHLRYYKNRYKPKQIKITPIKELQQYYILPNTEEIEAVIIDDINHYLNFL